MKNLKSAPVIITAVLLILAIAISAAVKRTNKKSAAKNTSATVSEAENPNEIDKTLDDMRGIWVTYMDLNMQYENDKSETAFREKFAAIAADCKSFGANTLIVQVRPFCDALYDSKLFPPSHILSGTQGKSAGYDALQIICDICKKFALKIHAWVNPYRVTADDTPQKLSEDNPYIKDKSIGIETESGIILDPSNPKARQLIEDGVKEIVENYDVDGIQFDDYFYPEDIKDLDNSAYQSYLNSVPESSAMSLETWRKSNVDLLVSETYLTVHKSKKDVVFGISPQGNLDNNEGLYADVASWCGKRGFIDYICPQIYFSLDNPSLDFNTALNRWTSLEYSDSVRLYVGLAGYKAGSDADEGTWLNKNTILAEEYNILQKNNVKGFMLYSYASLKSKDAQPEIKNLQNAVNGDQSDKTPSQ